MKARERKTVQNCQERETTVEVAALQVVESVRQGGAGSLVDRLSDKEGHLVGVLARSRHTDGALEKT